MLCNITCKKQTLIKKQSDRDFQSYVGGWGFQWERRFSELCWQKTLWPIKTKSDPNDNMQKIFYNDKSGSDYPKVVLPKQGQVETVRFLSLYFLSHKHNPNISANFDVWWFKRRGLTRKCAFNGSNRQKLLSNVSYLNTLTFEGMEISSWNVFPCIRALKYQTDISNGSNPAVRDCSKLDS